MSRTDDPDVLEAFEGDIPGEPEVNVGRFRDRVVEIAPAVLIFIGALVVWELVVILFGIQEFLLPRPSVIGTTLAGNWGEILSAAFATFKEALGGFALGATLGAGLALATARWTGFREGAMPFAIAANSAPIIALAPIMNQWFGLTNPFSKMAVVAIIVFFPVMINTTRGLIEVDPAEIELLRSYASTPRQLVLKVRVPNALPYLFSALKVATVLSVIGAIVAEYFGGPRNVLGVYITQQTGLFHFAEAWAAIVVATILGVGFYASVLVAERMLMPWHSAFRAELH